MENQEKSVVTATELKQNFGKYLAFVEEFNEVVITKNGAKVARLTPYITDFEQYLAVRERALDYQYDGKKVSYEEFMQIYEKSELRMEFIDGEIYVLGSPSITHQEILGKLYLIFHNYLEGNKCKVFIAPFVVHFRKRGIKEPDVCQPDLLVICDLEGNISDKDRYMGTPTLVVEILSDSTRAKDMINKLNTYRLSGVQEYWIIDPKKQNVIIYHLDNCEIADYRIYEAGLPEQQQTARLDQTQPGQTQSGQTQPIPIAKSMVFAGLEVSVPRLFNAE
ncbi:MAG: type II toxin-antitoxin system prevent-host-death family antitoxin [Bacillota bacterium]|jgi:prevent-host-death family protein